MATEGGADLREFLGEFMWNLRSHSFGWHELSEQEQRQELHEADAILGAIAEAGMVIVERKAAAILLGATADQYDMMDACQYANELYRLQREAESGQLQTLFHRDWAKDQYDLDRGAGRG